MASESYLSQGQEFSTAQERREHYSPCALLDCCPCGLQPLSTLERQRLVAHSESDISNNSGRELTLYGDIRIKHGGELIIEDGFCTGVKTNNDF